MKNISFKQPAKRECHIVSSVALGPEKEKIGKNNSYIIAADAGYLQLRALKIVPDLIVGDFDSAPKPGRGCEIIVLPKEKDDTDTVFAAKQAVERGYEKIRFFGAWGSRADHSMANLQLLLFLAKKGIEGVLEYSGGKIYCLGPGRHIVKYAENHVFSVLAADEQVKGVTIENGKYPLNNALLTNDVPLGVSNEFCGKDVFLSLAEGYAYVFVIKDE